MIHSQNLLNILKGRKYHYLFEAAFQTKLAYNGVHWRQYGEFVAGLTSADDKVNRDVETTDEG